MRRYQLKVSGPLLDRVYMVVAMHRGGLRSVVPSAVPAVGMDTLAVRMRVLAAAERQFQRSGRLNGRLDGVGLRTHCALSLSGEELLETASDRFALSARARDSIRRVARTIADLAAAERIESGHLGEAITLRASRHLGNTSGSPP